MPKKRQIQINREKFLKWVHTLLECSYQLYKWYGLAIFIIYSNYPSPDTICHIAWQSRGEGEERRPLSVFIYKSLRIMYDIFFILKTTNEYVYIIFRMCGVKMRIAGIRNIPGGKSARNKEAFYESFIPQCCSTMFQ
jgi:hypothetical protein